VNESLEKQNSKGPESFCRCVFVAICGKEERCKASICFTSHKKMALTLTGMSKPALWIHNFELGCIHPIRGHERAVVPSPMTAIGFASQSVPMWEQETYGRCDGRSAPAAYMTGSGRS